MDSQERRRCFQFTLAQLLVSTTLCGAVLVCFAPTSHEIVPRQTGRALDLAILGRGYFQFTDPVSGSFKYARNGHLSLNANGDLVFVWLNDEFLLQPQVTLPPDWVKFVVARNGMISVQQAGSTQLMSYGQIQLVLFANEDGLREAEPGLFEESDASGVATIVAPGTNGAGVVLQGWLTGAPGWTLLLADARLHCWLFGAMTAALVWLALEVRRQRRVLLAVVNELGN